MSSLKSLKFEIEKIANEIASDFKMEYIIESDRVIAETKIKVGEKDLTASCKFYLNELEKYALKDEFIRKNILEMVNYLRDEKEITGMQRGDIADQVNEIGSKYELKDIEKCNLRRELVKAAAKINLDKKLNNLMER